MIGPHDIQQDKLIQRITQNLIKFNEVLADANSILNDINENQQKLDELTQFWMDYQRNVCLQLSSTNSLPKP